MNKLPLPPERIELISYANDSIGVPYDQMLVFNARSTNVTNRVSNRNKVLAGIDWGNYKEVLLKPTNPSAIMQHQLELPKKATPIGRRFKFHQTQI